MLRFVIRAIRLPRVAVELSTHLAGAMLRPIIRAIRLPRPGTELSLNKPIPRKSRALSMALSIVPGAGHVYLGQHKKAALMFATAPLSVFIAWHDAQIMSQRMNDRGSIGDWEFFWHKSQWTLAETSDLETTDVVIAKEKREIDNSASDSVVQRQFRIERKWKATCTIEEEHIQTSITTVETATIKGRLTDLPVIDGLRASASRKAKSLSTTLREKFTRTESVEHIHEETVTITVPPRSHTTLYFNWKHQVSSGKLLLIDQFKNRISAPFTVIVGMTFDQIQIDGRPTTAS